MCRDVLSALSRSSVLQSPLSLAQVWCLSSGGDHQINRTVDRAVQSILLTGLLPDAHYAVAVAAVTSLGVGARSPPVSLLLSESPELSGGRGGGALCPNSVARIGRARATSANAKCYSECRGQAVMCASGFFYFGVTGEEI